MLQGIVHPPLSTDMAETLDGSPCAGSDEGIHAALVMSPPLQSPPILVTDW